MDDIVRELIEENLKSKRKWLPGLESRIEATEKSLGGQREQLDKLKEDIETLDNALKEGGG